MTESTNPLELCTDEIVSGPELDYHGYVSTLAARKIKGFAGTIDDNGNYYSEVYPGNVSLTDSITADYHGRFLIELIQNANDVHPDTRSDGAIEIVFDRSAGEFGILYIANRGAGFSEKNVSALCDMGLSTKPPGESIGNKGLGFRSVHHITDRPLIYSQAEMPADQDRFQGFCFGFAGDEELDELITDSRHRNLAKTDLPLFHVPIWLNDQPDVIRTFARRGFSTVICLPLRDASAAEAVENEISALRSQTVPMLLFLTRLERLAIRTVAADGNVNADFSLTRSEQTLAVQDLSLAIVDLGDSGRFLVSRRQVAEGLMKAAIKDGTDKKQLHKHWLKWEGRGEVALAVRLDDVIAHPRLYTFLPMGEQAKAPFSGYLHGSFFPTSNRKGLDATIKLNGLLLEEATTLAAVTISFLTRSDDDGIGHPLDRDSAALAAVDLLCWRKVESLETPIDLASQVARKVALQLGVPAFDDAPVIPCLGHDVHLPPVGWCTPSQARIWRYEFDTFSAKVAAAYAPVTRVAPIWPGLASRTERLKSFLEVHCSRFPGLPTTGERAELAERVASDLLADSRTPVARWPAYYRDLSLFLEKAGSALAGRRLLLCADGKLHETMTPAEEIEGEGKVRRRKRKSEVKASIFAPPARHSAGRNDEDILTPPDILAENFAFLSNRFDWYGELAPARVFLENAKLIFQFDREVVLAQLSRSIRQDGRKGIRVAALRWAFQIWRQPRETGRAFKLQSQHRFFVPNLAGDFIDATEALFSESWPDETRGRLLERFLDSAPPDLADLIDVRRRRLAARSHPAFKGAKSTQLWVEFLMELGVQSGLHPIAKKVQGPVFAYRLKNFTFCNDIGISAQAAEAWKASIEETKPGATQLPSTTEYLVRGDIWWMPGQGDIDQFSRECRELFAMLIIAWLESSHLTDWTIVVRHLHFTISDTREWPTPIAAFLRSAAWVPAEEPSAEGGQLVTVRPSKIWLAPDGGTERFPPFLRRPTIPIMRTLERLSSEKIRTLCSLARLRVLYQPETLVEQAEFLAEQYSSDGFDRYFERHFLNIYYRTWVMLADRFDMGADTLGENSRPQALVARRGSRPEVVRMVAAGEDVNEVVYVRDGDNETVASLVEASGRLLFDPRSSHPVRTGALLRKLYGLKVRLLSEVNYSMVADGHEVGAGNMASATNLCPRLRIFAAISMEALKGTELQRLPADRSTIVARLEHLMLERVANISFRIDGVEDIQEVEVRRAFALKLPSGQPFVVVKSAGPMSWDVIGDSLSAICEAIDQPALEPHMRLLVLMLASSDKLVDEFPTMDAELEWLCEMLRLNENGKRAVRETLGARLDRLIPWIRALLYMSGGAEAIDAFTEQESDVVKDISKLREALARWLPSLELDAETVLEACRSKFSIAELRDTLHLDFERLNQSLVAVGEKPDIYPDLQASIVANYIHENELAIIDELRNAHFEQLNRNDPAWAYWNAREAVRTLAPNADWLLRYKEVPPEQVADHVVAWLRAQGAKMPGTNLHCLKPVDEVRTTNGGAILKFVKAANALVKAWCAKENRAVPAAWQDSDGGVASLRGAFDKAGILDFRPLDNAGLLIWSSVIGAWPAEMPQSLERADLGIVEADFDTERAKALAEAEDRKREARSISFNGHKVDPEEVDWQNLSEELAASLSKKMLSTPLGAPATLLPVKQKAERAPRGGSSGSPWTPPQRPPSQKTDMVGRLGELVVYHWLRDRLPKQNIDAAWLSNNALPFTGRPGSDSLGYDFGVSFRNQAWQIEVKASLGDPCSFEMGESEVRAGRIAARSRSGVQYWIAYVSNLSEPARTRVDLLPNPMSEEGEAVLNLLGEGLRYSFRRS